MSLQHNDDLTSRLDCEQRAAELHAILKSLPDAVYIGTAQGISYTNEQGYRILGFSGQEELRREVSRLGALIQVRDAATGRPVPPEELVFARALQGESATSEVIVRNVSTGEDVILRSSASPIVLDGEIQGAVAINTDITRQKKGDAELRYQLDLMNGIMRSVSEAIFLLDREGQVTFANPAAEWMFGWRESELQGQLLHDVIHHSSEQICPSGDVFTRETFLHDQEDIFYRRDGHSISVTCSKSALVENGKTIGAVLVVRDITDRKLAEERLRETQKLESIGQLATGVAHDFNNLLMGILGSASLLQETVPADFPDRGRLDDIVKASERAADLTRELLAYSGKGRFFVEELDLAAVAAHAGDYLNASAPQKIAIRLESDGQPARVEADPGQMEQLLAHLVKNAVEAIGDSAGEVRLRVRREQLDRTTAHRLYAQENLAAGPYVRLEVEDTGAGMDGAVMARVFEPFFSTKFLGRGLGLAAAQGIVRAQGGAIRVHSAPGKGACFQVLLPAVKEPSDIVDVRPTPAGGGIVLLVEAEALVRRIAEAALARSGMKALFAANGWEGVELFRRHADRISVVILDILMPVMDGDEALHYIRAIRPDVPVIVTSGSSHNDALRRFRGGAVSGFLQKPFTPAELEAKIAEVTGGTRGD
jgi:PAS domain S-box-containing protein